jgi:small subunit ribosomal protein S6
VKAYELLIMKSPTLDEDGVAAIVDRAQQLITAEGGVVDSIDDWGKRPLAYEIDHQKEGYYTLIDFHHEPFAIAEIERVLRITDGIVRYLLVAREDRE